MTRYEITTLRRWVGNEDFTLSSFAETMYRYENRDPIAWVAGIMICIIFEWIALYYDWCEANND